MSRKTKTSSISPRGEDKKMSQRRGTGASEEQQKRCDKVRRKFLRYENNEWPRVSESENVLCHKNGNIKRNQSSRVCHSGGGGGIQSLSSSRVDVILALKK
jgi:hypothetical protein